MEELRALVARVRQVKDAALVQGELVQDERGLEHVARVVATGADILAMLLKQACAGLDHFYWGVWGSARRVKASTRELAVLDS